MLTNYRPLLGLLYVLLFISFVAMSLGQAVGSWISTTYGGWVTLEAVAAYAAYLAGLIWVIRRLSKAAGIEVQSTSSWMAGGMSEMEFIRSEMRAAEQAQVRQVEALEDENGPTLKS